MNVKQFIEQEPNKRKRRIFLIILSIFAILVRIDFNTWHKVELFPDTFSYLRVTNNILMQGQILDAGRPPVYPVFLLLNFLFFGYENFLAVAVIQSIVGLVSLFLVYRLTFNITKSFILSAVITMISTFNLNAIFYDTAITTECLSLFLVLISFILLDKIITQNFPIKLCILLNICLLLLIFLRPILIMILFFVPVIALICYLRQKIVRHVFILLSTFIFLVVIPVIVWGMVMKIKYGFFGISSIGHKQAFVVIVNNNMEEYASPKYKSLGMAIKAVREATQDPDQKNNVDYIISKLEQKFPRENSQDYKLYMQFSQDVIFNAPFVFLKKSIAKIPDILKKIRRHNEYAEERGVIATLSYYIYRYSIYRPYRNGLIFIFLLLFSILVPVIAYRKNIVQWLIILFIILFIWFYIGMISLLTAAAFARYRMTIEPLIYLIILSGIAEILQFFKTLFFTRR